MASLRRKGSRSILQVQTALEQMEADPAHHLAGPFTPQTPIDSLSPVSRPSPPRTSRARNQPPASTAYKRLPSRGLWGDLKSGLWVVNPASAFKILSVPIALYINWALLAPYFAPAVSNPFASLLFISHLVPGTDVAGDPRYQKGWLDLVFIAYHIIVWSFIRQFFLLEVCPPLARWFGLKNPSKIDRFGEQVYAIVYWGFTGLWGTRIMSQLPTWWYQTEYFWIDYPHWAMKPELKRYYLMQGAYWLQQLIVMVFRLEKPRKDYYELIAHHIVTLWLVGWSYLINLTYIGNAVFTSMDIPDVFLATSKLLNYIQFEKTKTVFFVVFLGVWSYFRIWLNFVMLWSVWFEFDLIPERTNRWYRPEGVWLVWWMKYQVFVPIMLLLFLNLFWYFLILRIAKRAVFDTGIDDVRSDDEDENEDEGGDGEWDEKED